MTLTVKQAVEVLSLFDGNAHLRGFEHVTVGQAGTQELAGKIQEILNRMIDEPICGYARVSHVKPREL